MYIKIYLKSNTHFIFRFQTRFISQFRFFEFFYVMLCYYFSFSFLHYTHPHIAHTAFIKHITSDKFRAFLTMIKTELSRLNSKREIISHGNLFRYLSKCCPVYPSPISDDRFCICSFPIEV